MIRFIENIGDYYSQHFFADDFPKKVFDRAGYVTQKKDENGVNTDNHISQINARISPLREKYYRFKNDLINIHREKDKVKRTHDFHREVLDLLGYVNGTPEYNAPVFLNDTEVIPVLYNFSKGGKPYLFIMEMKAIVREGDKDPEGIYEQTWIKDDWEKVFPKTWGNYELKPDVIKDALSELFLLHEEDRPTYVIVLAGAKIFLIHYEKWKYDSFLLFDLEELFVESKISTNRDYLALFYALLAKPNFLGATDSVLHALDEDAHKAAYGVTQNLKKGVIYAVENLANEAIWYKKRNAKTPEEKEVIEKLMAEEKFARELKDECLTMVYRLLFLFYAEAREDLEILPIKDSVYQKGYSLEMLRDLEMVALTTDSSRNGEFFSQSLWKLFDYLHNGIKTNNGFEMKPLDSPLFVNEELKHLSGVQFRNMVLQQIIKRLSLSDQSKSKRRGRISYANLGINQLGSVYESLLAYSGFFAAETLIEVKAADDADGKEGTFLVPLSRRDDFKEEEILKDSENPVYDVQISKGHFVYRLNGRDRKKSASYYTPEVLTQTTVKYTLKGIIDILKERQEKGEDCADEILSLKILEPAMGAAAFHNEVINQLADAYLELKETEEVRKGRKRIVPGLYNDELQKVKAFIAANNVYGVDLNPTAVELGKLSLWLNCMHRNMETPFFAHRLGTGNAVVGCWLKTYKEEDIMVEYPTEGTTKQRSTPIPKAWWDKEPKRVTWDAKSNLTRKPNEYYHFLLPDDNMLASANIELLKEQLSAAQKTAIANWNKEIKQPLSREECKRLQKLCTVIDSLLEEHYKQIKSIIKETKSTYSVYGQPAAQMTMKGYDEKELLSESRNARSAPFYKLRMVMDYWCSLWFWDARKIADLPNRKEWYNEIENILGVDLSGLPENVTSKDIADNIKKQAADTSLLFGNRNRLQIVEVLHNQHRFFHHELEFVEVFKEKGGFDVIVGNPPWVSIEMDETGVISEKHPEIAIRKTTSPQVRKIANATIAANSNLKVTYETEILWAEATKEFLGSPQNYFSLQGQRNNLYKCLIYNSFFLINNQGFAGLLHPEGVYEDPSAGCFRQELFQHLSYHFQFVNSMNLFIQVAHKEKFSINVYSGRKTSFEFISINNLFHPITIDGSLNSGVLPSVGGIQIKDNATNSFNWNISPGSNRVININEEKLKILAKLFENSSNWKSSKLPSIHSTEIISVLSSLSNFKNKLSELEYFSTDGLNETNAIRDGVIRRETRFPNIANNELVLSGPHFYVSNPFNKTPREICVEKADYDVVNLMNAPDDFVSRTNYVPDIPLEEFKQYFSKFGDKWLQSFKVVFSKMLNVNMERTLQPAIISPNITHTNGVISVYMKKEDSLIELTALCSSLVIDFFIKVLGKSNLYEDTIKNFLIGIDKKYVIHLNLRALLLNCVNKEYTSFWERNWNVTFNSLQWSKIDCRLKDITNIKKIWKLDTPLRNYYERRQALIEIDVITALAFGLSIQELILIYEVQFPVLQQNEDDTWYDQKGNIIFTCSKGLTGVGIDRPEWDRITEEINPMQRSIKDGETYVHTITKSELYQGQQITYYPPFDKCDRVEDYKVAWAHFENVFATENEDQKTTNFKSSSHS